VILVCARVQNGCVRAKRVRQAPRGGFAAVGKPSVRTAAGSGEIAEAVHFLAHLGRSAWTFELDLRPFGERW
jgi:hypothetical protein